jgi:hypothetical protein
MDHPRPPPRLTGGRAISKLKRLKLFRLITAAHYDQAEKRNGQDRANDANY